MKSLQQTLDQKAHTQLREPSLQRVKAAFDQLQIPVDPQKTIVAAGTNGKGSTCNFLRALLQAKGKSVFMHTSPHLKRLNERFNLNGREAPDELLEKAFDQLQIRVSLEPLSHFEILTLMAGIIAFELKTFDYVILEVGLGGLYDATNVFPHSTSVITPLGMDHLAFLGPTINDVARNKLGIVRENQNVVYQPFPADALPALLESKAQHPENNWIEVLDWSYATDQGPRFFVDYKGCHLELSQPGHRAAQNAATALATFESLGFEIGPESKKALKETLWVARFTPYLFPGMKPKVFLSGDHNPQGLESLKEILQHFHWRQLHLIVAIGAGKSFEEQFSSLQPLPNTHWHLTQGSFKATPVNSLNENALRPFELVNPDPSWILGQLASRLTEDDLVVVTGSLYMFDRLL